MDKQNVEYSYWYLTIHVDIWQLKGIKCWCMLHQRWILKTLWQVKEVSHKRPHIIWPHLYDISRTDKSMNTESSGCRGLGLGDWWWQLKGTGFQDHMVALFLVFAIMSEVRERNIIWYCLYAVSKKNWYKWTYLQNRNRLTDLENEPGEQGGGGGAGQRGKGIESLELRCTYCYTRTYCLRPGTLLNIV